MNLTYGKDLTLVLGHLAGSASEREVNRRAIMVVMFRLRQVGRRCTGGSGHMFRTVKTFVKGR